MPVDRALLRGQLQNRLSGTSDCDTARHRKPGKLAVRLNQLNQLNLASTVTLLHKLFVTQFCDHFIIMYIIIVIITITVVAVVVLLLTSHAVVSLGFCIANFFRRPSFVPTYYTIIILNDRTNVLWFAFDRFEWNYATIM